MSYIEIILSSLVWTLSLYLSYWRGCVDEAKANEETKKKFLEDQQETMKNFVQEMKEQHDDFVANYTKMVNDEMKKFYDQAKQDNEHCLLCNKRFDVGVAKIKHPINEKYGWCSNECFEDYVEGK